MRKLLLLVASVAILAIAVAPTSAAGKKGASTTKNVKICDCLKFKPHKLKIKTGTKVVWTWGGMLKHNVTVISGPDMFHSPTMKSGTYSHTFNTKGTYKLHCTIHGFKMTVKVK